MSAAALLRSARDKVAHGWLQNAGRDGYGRVCAAQAIADAHIEAGGNLFQMLADDELSTAWTAAGNLLLAAAGERTGKAWLTIPSWNDHWGRTQQEVVDTFDHAIKLAERDEGPMPRPVPPTFATFGSVE